MRLAGLAAAAGMGCCGPVAAWCCMTLRVAATVDTHSSTSSRKHADVGLCMLLLLLCMAVRGMLGGLLHERHTYGTVFTQVHDEVGQVKVTLQHHAGHRAGRRAWNGMKFLTVTR